MGGVWLTEVPVLDPTALYTTTAVADGLTAPVLVHALGGFVDAGAAGRLAAAHLLATLEHELVAEFDPDQLVDYRSRRPVMVYDKDHYESYDAPVVRLHAVHDLQGRTFLLLTGPEPDLQWEGFVAAVRDLVQRFDVSTTVGLHAIPMAVPHTRPIGVLSHGTREGLAPQRQSWVGTVQIPASVAALLELRLGEWGHDAMGFVVQVPHYLSDTTYPEAAAVLVDNLAEVADLTLPTTALLESAEVTRAAIAEQVSESEEVAQVVHALEQQYDAYAGARGRTSLMAGDSGPFPSADELGAEVERFLAAQADDPDA